MSKGAALTIPQPDTDTDAVYQLANRTLTPAQRLALIGLLGHGLTSAWPEQAIAGVPNAANPAPARKPMS